MHILSLFQCDECGKIASLKSDTDWLEYSDTWHDGFKYQFCENCRDTFQSQERIREDERIVERLSSEKFESATAQIR